MPRLLRCAMVACLVPAFLLAVANIATADEWKPLFNGQDLTGWTAVDGPMSSWKVEEGLLYCSGGGGGWLSTTDEYANFELELEFRVPEGGNSGVFLRAPHQGNPAFAGMEVQVLDDRAPEYAKLEKYQYCGSLYGIAAPKLRVSKPAGDWQTMNIVCNGRKVQVKLNGTPIVDADLDAHPNKVATNPGIKRTAGFVGLQNHGTRLDYRNIKIKKLP